MGLVAHWMGSVPFLLGLVPILYNVDLSSNLAKRVCSEDCTSIVEISFTTDAEDLVPNAILPVLDKEPNLGHELDWDDLCEHMDANSYTADKFNLAIEDTESSSPKVSENLAKYVEP